jgi:hypothetical protein
MSNIKPARKALVAGIPDELAESLEWLDARELQPLSDAHRERCSRRQQDDLVAHLPLRGRFARGALTSPERRVSANALRRTSVTAARLASAGVRSVM